MYVSAFLLNRLKECYLILEVVNDIFFMNIFEIELCFMSFMLKVSGINQKIILVIKIKYPLNFHFNNHRSQF